MPYPAKLQPESVLEAAQSLLENGGFEALTMRELAHTLSVRPSSLYRHFASREELLFAVGQKAALALNDVLQDAAVGKEPTEGLKAAAYAYIQYAVGHPQLYALLLSQPPELTPEQLSASGGKQLWNTFLALVGAISGNPDDTDNTVAFWTFLHGFCSLSASGTFGVSGPKGGLEVGLNALIRSMQSRAANQD